MNPHYEFGVTELEDIRDCYPEVYHRIGKNVFNKKLGRKYFRLGLYFEELGDLARAREAYRKAMLLRKLSFRYGWEYCRSAFLSASVRIGCFWLLARIGISTALLCPGRAGRNDGRIILAGDREVGCDFRYSWLHSQT